MFRQPGLVAVAALVAVVCAGPTAHATSPSVPAPATLASVTDVAHRGASTYAPENTIAAFKLAQAQGADMFELDVQETRDHCLILMHDTTLARTTNAEAIFPDRAPWEVSDFTLAEIRMLDAGSWFGERFRGEPVPTLAETLRVMRGGRLGLLLEVKAPERYPGIEQRVAGELRRNPYWLIPDPRGRRLVVQGFDWDSMRTFHRILPWVPIGLLGTPAVTELPKLAEFATQINPRHRDLSADYVERIHALRMEVFTWTVDDPSIMRQVIAYKVDGVITNRPDLLRGILTAGTGQARTSAGANPAAPPGADPAAAG